MRTWSTAALVFGMLACADAAIGASNEDLLSDKTWLCHGGETFSLASFGRYVAPVYTEDNPIVLTFVNDPGSVPARTFSFSNRSQGLIFGTWEAGKGGKFLLTLDPTFVDVAYVPYIRTVILDILSKSKAVKRAKGTVAPEDLVAPTAGFKPSVTIQVSSNFRLRCRVRNTLAYSATVRDAEGNAVRRVRNAKLLERGTYTGRAPQ